MECHKCHNKVRKGQEVCLNCGHILGYESMECKMCPHCNRDIPINANKCPFCNKKMNPNNNKKTIFFIIIIALLNVIVLISLYRTPNPRVEANYRDQCVPITYEQMIRKADYYHHYNVYFSGKIKNITTINRSRKIMELTIMVDNQEEQMVDVEFKNIESIGYMLNDEVTIYGKYQSLNGNIPFIKAKYVIIKKAN